MWVCYTGELVIFLSLQAHACVYVPKFIDLVSNDVFQYIDSLLGVTKRIEMFGGSTQAYGD